MRRRPGRPRTPVFRLVEAARLLAVGASWRDACAQSGVSRAALYRWIRERPETFRPPPKS